MIELENKNLIRVILIILIIINCLTIFKFSSEQSEQSNKTSGKVVEAIVEKSPKTRNLNKQEKEKKKEELVVPVRKTAHFSVYACLGVLIFLLAKTFKGADWKKTIISVIMAFFYACSDEIHQNFVNGRSCEFRDVLIDTSGAFFGVILVLVVCGIGGRLGEKVRVEKNREK